MDADYVIIEEIVSQKYLRTDSDGTEVYERIAYVRGESLPVRLVGFARPSFSLGNNPDGIEVIHTPRTEWQRA